MDPDPQRYITRRKRRKRSSHGYSVYKRAGGKCEYCLKAVPFKEHGPDYVTSGWQIDHLIPRAKGGNRGGRDRTNLVMACAKCNADKRDDLVGEWIPPIGVASFWARRALNIACEAMVKKSWRMKERANVSRNQED